MEDSVRMDKWEATLATEVVAETFPDQVVTEPMEDVVVMEVMVAEEAEDHLAAFIFHVRPARVSIASQRTARSEIQAPPRSVCLEEPGDQTVK